MLWLQYSTHGLCSSYLHSAAGTTACMIKCGVAAVGGSLLLAEVLLGGRQPPDMVVVACGDLRSFIAVSYSLEP